MVVKRERSEGDVESQTGLECELQTKKYVERGRHLHEYIRYNSKFDQEA